MKMTILTDSEELLDVNALQLNDALVKNAIVD